MPSEEDGYELTDMSFDEVSLVRRGANQHAEVVLWKSDGGCHHKRMKKGMKSCPDCGEEMDDDMDHGVMKSAPTAVEERPSTVTDVRSTTQENEMPEATDELAPETAAYIAQLEDQISSLTAALNDATSTLEKMAEQDDDDDSTDDIIKSADPRVRELITKAQNEAEQARKEAAIAAEIAKSERDQRVTKEFIEKAAALSHLPVKAEQFGPVLKAASEKLSEQEYQLIWSLLSAANEGSAQGSVFNEIGKSTSNPDNPLSALAQRAGSTDVVALAKAALENPDLYEQYRSMNKGA